MSRTAGPLSYTSTPSLGLKMEYRLKKGRLFPGSQHEIRKITITARRPRQLIFLSSQKTSFPYQYVCRHQSLYYT